MKNYNGIPVLLFEENVPEFIQTNNNAVLSIANSYYKFGNASLKWQFKNNSELIINRKIGYRKSNDNDSDKKRDSFVIWIYNEIPIEDKLKFEFGRKDEKIPYCHFSFGLNFQGWRCCWVMYDRDMEGAPIEDMNLLTIKAPKNIVDHTLYINKIILSVPIDTRFHSRDYQVPFVNLEADRKSNSHWMSLFTFSEVEKHAPYDNEVTTKMKNDCNIISERFKEYILIDKKDDLDSLIEEYKKYNISIKKDVIKGRSVDFLRYFELFDVYDVNKYAEKFNSINVKSYINLMYRLALLYYRSNQVNKLKIQDMFITLLEYLYYQGFAEGSGIGTYHHFGYDFQDYYKAVYLMKEVIEKKGYLERTQKTMSWFSGLGRIFYNSYEAEGCNMDVLNTFLLSMLASILIIKHSSKKVNLLKQYGKWLDYAVDEKDGLKGPFKQDGCGFHHCNLYPAYTIGGLKGVTPIIYLLRSTLFRLSEKGHKLVKKVTLCLRLYSNKYEWLVSLSARHPKGEGQHCELDLLPFKYLALAGTPDGKRCIDEEMAAAYLRLIDNKKDETAIIFRKYGIKAEELRGHWSLNYGALAIHRRDDWLVGARGHSRYLWANESYMDANLYGRYITHGHLQIMAGGSPINNRDSGYVQEGWDWCSWPGTTTIHLPMEKMKGKVTNVDNYSGYEEMLLSDETFVGGLNIQNENGMFAMKLHEHPKYEGSHIARKSVFFFNNRVICLGSNINNNNRMYPTRTTLFQNHLSPKDQELIINKKIITNANYCSTYTINEGIWIMDNKENGYYLPAGQILSIKKGIQYSKAQNTGEDTKGRFAKAFIEHGKAPLNGEYEYMIIIKSNYDELEYIKNMQLNNSIYEVIQKDEKAHIVFDYETNIMGYAFFEISEDIDKGLVASIDTPCMVMTKEVDEKVILSICDPDLRLYKGTDKSQYDKDGNRKEVSVYSRKWINNASKQYLLTIKIKGKWECIGKRKECRKIVIENNNSIIQFMVKDAKPIELELKKIK
ncbi:chondroitinase family polysaccharide lyase [Vallitalea sp.]|jgi:chondroitin-sulfate-ABC endolyase/exolyase|uniref:chondroitinase family polysaccharide lyase n=1 Tax=Vallitalea sp. TaxID=1882829 RepID=UPI0025EFB98D|nr:chondroitinase family polysaccharide lyase [Vallitalea sp.]MCT4685794.1 polysaccharide lyase beta-sandwich domain-containing protein [Vallitalea sp.]